MTRADGKCGCVVGIEGGVVQRFTLDYCPLHGVAPQMLAALREIVDTVDKRSGYVELVKGGHLYLTARAAIAKAGGGA